MTTREETTTPVHDDSSSSNNNDSNDHMEEDDQIPSPKFEVRQRVFARDGESGSGLLYKAVVRRQMYGKPPLRQLRVGVDQVQDVEAFLKEEQQPCWHYYCHYLGWNVKWDRWVDESSLFEPSDETKELAAKLAKELSLVKKNKKGKDGVKIMAELKRRMELLQKGDSNEGEDNEEGEQDEKQSAVARKRQKRNNKASLARELQLRERDLCSTAQQNIVLPFSLKKVMVEEWEIVSQCGMLPNLPSQVPVRQALQQYLASKLDQLGKPIALSVDEGQDKFVTDQQTEQAMKQQKEAEQSTQQQTEQEKEQVMEQQKEQEMGQQPEQQTEEQRDLKMEEQKKELTEEEREVENKKKEWTDMVEGICLFFDQALDVRLLYRQELGQHTVIEADSELCEMRKCDLYGCEHLLRLFCHLPSLLAAELTEKEVRPILSKIADLIRFLQKHQSTLFTQSYRRPTPEELHALEKRKRKAGKRKRAKPSQLVDGAESVSAAAAAPAAAKVVSELK